MERLYCFQGTLKKTDYYFKSRNFNTLNLLYAGSRLTKSGNDIEF
jgi:hypothetical protein